MPHRHAIAGPIARRERLQALDVLRGFALLGILLMNIEAFVGPLNAALLGIDPGLRGADRAVDVVNEWLVRGKFFPLFSLLFGMGFVVMRERAEARGADATGPYLRRMLALLLIGVLHAVLVWSGDILVGYALAGVLLLLFRRTPVARLPAWGVALYAVPVLLAWLVALSVLAAQADPALAASIQADGAKLQAQFLQVAEAQRQAYGAGSYADAVLQRLADTRAQLGYFPFAGPMYLGLFLIGAWFMRSGALRDPPAHRALFARLRAWGLLAGLPAAALGLWLVPGMDMSQPGVRAALATTLTHGGGLLACLGYMAAIVLALQHPAWARRLAWFAPAGRMALTNYLMQSVICTLVFYGYGLGAFERLPRTWQPLFAIALFAAQVAGSRWWLARYRFGPMEWLWRWATYGVPPPMRLATASQRPG